MSSGIAASEMVKDSGILYDKAYNLFGEEVTTKNTDPADLGAKWGNQTTPAGTVIEFENPLSEADFFFHSFCGAWYEPSHRYGEDIGFVDDVWLTAEEWVIGRAFNRADGSLGHAMANETMGLAATVTDIENSTLYSVPALATTGYEKMMPLNPGTEEYQVMVMAGYNHGHEPAPLKIFIGRKGYDAEGNKITSEHNERDQFLGRNGLLWGQLYGQAVSNKTIKNLGLTNDSNGNGLFDEHIVDEYLTNAAAPDKFKGRF